MASAELTQRVAVAAVGIPTVLALLYFGGWVLAVPVAVIAALGCDEVYRLVAAKDVRPLRWLGMGSAAALVLAGVVFSDFVALAPWALGGICALAAASLLLSMPLRGVDGSPLAATSATVFGVIYVSVPLVFVVLLHAMPERLAWGGLPGSPWMGGLVVALPLAATWVGDSAAYFVGSAFGKARIAPSISPKKSWVGGAAGLVGSALAAAVWLLIARPLLPGMPTMDVVVVAAMGAVMGIGGQIGDFAESLLKREAGVKDSGALFPGHGGVLDRLDALVFAFPLAYVLLMAAEALT